MTTPKQAEIAGLVEALDSAVATFAAVRAIASDLDEWATYADHFHKLAGQEIRKLNAMKAALSAEPVAAPVPVDAGGGFLLSDDVIERASQAYAQATGYYVEFHRGLSSPSADKIRDGVRAALEAARVAALSPASPTPGGENAHD